jgi:WD40 repeat protein/DNA-binding SARP family transcriptional activator
MLEIRLLGQFSVQFSGTPIVIPSRPAQSLLAYLALNAGVSHRREKLAGLLWPDSTEKNARGYLRMALWRLRKSFEEASASWADYLGIDDIAVSFEPAGDFWLDADAILQHREPVVWSIEELTDVVSAYRGELLPGFYDEWTVLERERLQGAFDHKMKLLLDRLLADGRWDEVLAQSERWIALGHVPEPAFRALMMAHAATGDSAGATAAFNRYATVLQRELGVEPSEEMKTLREQLARGKRPAEWFTLPGKEEGPITDRPPAPGAPPFKGLHFFDVNDSHLFFGREMLTARLAGHLLERHFLAVVVGASGSGKSSIVRAGLIPALQRGESLVDGTKPPAESQDWLVHIITPTAHPLEALAASLCRETESVTAAATLQDDLAKDTRSLHLFAKRLTEERQAPRLLLVVDQFEELFTHCDDRVERTSFIDNLMTAVSPKLDGPTTVVITLRADFYAHCAEHAELREALARNQEYIGPMNSQELRRAIEEPARKGGWDFQPGLVDLLLRDVRGEPGALPLLSHALLETWNRRSGRTLTLKGYAQAGGVRGAIAKTAETVFNQQLAEPQQAITRGIFIRLTDLGEETQDTRRRAALVELNPAGRDPGEVEMVLNQLANARLITISEEWAEVAHEALIREWPRLREWLAEDREGLLIHRHLTLAAQEWEAMERDPGELYRGSRLAQAAEWAEGHASEMNPLERNFLQASSDLAKQKEAEREVRRQSELETAQQLAETERKRAADRARSIQRLRWLAIGLGLVLAIALISAGFAIQQRSQAEREANQSQSRELAAAAVNNLAVDPELSILLALEALSLDRTVEAENALHQAVQTSRLLQTQPMFELNSFIWTAMYSSDESKLVVYGANSVDITRATPSVQIWDAVTGEHLYDLDEPLAADFLLGNEQLVTFDLRETPLKFTFRNLASGEERSLATLDLSSANIARDNLEWVNLSPDGTQVALALEDGQLGVWDLATGEAIFQTDYGYQDAITGTYSCVGRGGNFVTSDIGLLPVEYVTFSPDGALVAAGGCDGTAKVWNIESGEEILTLSGHGEGWPVADIEFSSDDKWLATGCWDGTAKLWDAETGRELATFAGHTSEVFSIDLNSTATMLATGGADGVAKVWDVDSGQELVSLAGHDDSVFFVGFDGPGNRLITGGREGAVRMWDVTPAGLGEELVIDHGIIHGSFNLDPDKGQLLVDGAGQAATVWDLRTGSLVCRTAGASDHSCPVLLSPDGTYTLTKNDQGHYLLRPAGSETALQTVITYTLVAFSADSTRLATVDESGQVYLFDLDTLFGGPTELESLGPEQASLSFSTEEGKEVYDLAYGPDGSYLATAGVQGAKLWDAGTGQRVHHFMGGERNVWGVSFSPDGKRLVTVGPELIVRIWDVDTRESTQTFTGFADYLNDVNYSQDGTRIATAGWDGTARIWDAETGEELLTLDGHTSVVRDVVFSPDGTRLYTISDDGTSRVYLLDLDEFMQIAQQRVTRTLTETECRTFLHLSDCPTSAQNQ